MVEGLRPVWRGALVRGGVVATYYVIDGSTYRVRDDDGVKEIWIGGYWKPVDETPGRGDATTWARKEGT